MWLAGLMSVVFKTSDLLWFSFPLVHLYVSEDRLILEARFGLARLWRPWVVDREDVAYIGARARAPIMEREALDEFGIVVIRVTHEAQF